MGERWQLLDLPVEVLYRITEFSDFDLALAHTCSLLRQVHLCGNGWTRLPEDCNDAPLGSLSMLNLIRKCGLFILRGVFPESLNCQMVQTVSQVIFQRVFFCQKIGLENEWNGGSILATSQELTTFFESLENINGFRSLWSTTFIDFEWKIACTEILPRVHARHLEFAQWTFHKLRDWKRKYHGLPKDGLTFGMVALGIECQKIAATDLSAWVIWKLLNCVGIRWNVNAMKSFGEAYAKHIEGFVRTCTLEQKFLKTYLDVMGWRRWNDRVAGSVLRSNHDEIWSEIIKQATLTKWKPCEVESVLRVMSTLEVSMRGSWVSLFAKHRSLEELKVLLHENMSWSLREMELGRNEMNREKQKIRYRSEKEAVLRSSLGRLQRFETQLKMEKPINA